MLAQFQSLYPNGSLISELVQIFQGKYIVRVSVQIEGVTRATGMAAAETVESAEDQARNRALMVLSMTKAPQETAAVSPKSISPVPSNPSVKTTGEDFVSSQWSAVSGQEVSSPPVHSDTVTNDREIANTRDIYNQNLGQLNSLTTNQEPEFEMPPMENFAITSASEPDNQYEPGMAASNVTPFTPRNYTPPEELATPISTGKKKKKSEPVDLSDVLAKTDVELQRLGWTPEQGREHLIKTYGKRGRTLLTVEELHGFLKYLESQTTPIDPLTGF
ncbi:MAG: hypothetical protein HEQ35_25110 [Gloeotrichia echinulata IR180]|jgi:hypothetical protein|nr:hypothetical protein [Gloeotrichia echinulata DEX184]